MNSLIWGNCRAATLTACQTGRTKQTGTNAQCSSYLKESVDILLNYSFPMDSAPPFPFPPPFPLCPSLLSYTHTIHQISLFTRSHAVHDELTDDLERAMDAIILTQTGPSVTRDGSVHEPTCGFIVCTLCEGEVYAHKPMKEHFGKPTNCSLN